MINNDDIDYGPLKPLIGAWYGNHGTDIAPEPYGEENNLYFETITFNAAGDVTNAESQELVALQYRQLVQRKSNGKVFHDQSGYWMWDAANALVMHSFTIPRAVGVLAGGEFGGVESDGGVRLEVYASLDSADWPIMQSPFMRDNARTTAFRQQLVVHADRLSYSQTTMVDIYGKVFEHTDDNKLVRVPPK